MGGQQERLSTLSSLLPPPVLRRISGDAEPVCGPEAERLPGAVLFADISGFTALAEDLASQGPGGVETLSGLLNGYFGHLIELVVAHGGEVVEFAGDALLALWPAAGAGAAHAATANARGGLATGSGHLPAALGLTGAVLRATECAQAVQSRLHAHVAAGQRLSLRVAVGAGEIVLAHVGGVAGRWEFIAAGQPLVELAVALPQANPGEIVLTLPAWERVRASGRFAGVARDRAVRLEAGATGPEPTPHAAARLTLPARAEAVLSAYLPSAVLARLNAGQERWLAELRRVAVLFMELGGLAACDGDDALTRLQAAAAASESVIARHEGTVAKLLVDDKGLVLVAAFGLPPLSHQDDPARALEAALELRSELAAQGVASAAGIATGQVFCGLVGSDLRREYTILGDVVNLAARLMQSAGSELLCDAVTQAAARGQFVFDELPPLTVKGKATPVIAHRVRGERIVEPVRARGASVGRERERELCEERLAALCQGRSGVIVIEGEAGIGKSRLALDLAVRARELGCQVAVGTADAVGGPLCAWQPVFEQLLALPAAAEGPEARWAALLARPDAPDPALAPLLGPILGLEAPDSALTAQMQGQVRADNTHELLVGLLEAAAVQAPLVIVLEDAHDADSAAWMLAGRAARRVPGLLLVLVTRPLPAPLPPEQAQLVGPEDALRIPLGPLIAGETRELLARCLGARTLPDPLVEFVHRRAEGHPFFSEELAYALRDSGVLTVEDGVCALAPEARDLGSLRFPDTVQGVIISRIDRLAPPQQLALKVASVIGRRFPVHVLAAVHPVADDREQLGDYLQRIARLDLLLAEPEELGYLFKHAITHEVSYNLMLFSQRRQLHRAVAECYEREHAAELSPYFALLAHHWALAEESPRALDYLEKAGAQALGSGAYREAHGYFARALDQLPEAVPGAADDAATRLRRARLERQLGEALWGVGDLGACGDHMARSLVLLQQPVPRSSAGWRWSLLGGALRQLWHRVLGRLVVARREQTRHELREAAHATGRVAERLYFERQPLSMLAATLRALNLAERAGPVPRLARHAALAGTMLHIGGWPRLARGLFRRATAMAEAIDDLGDRAYVHFARGLALIGTGAWDEVDRELGEAMALYGRVGDQQELQITRTLVALSAYFRGRFEDAHEQFAELGERARAIANLQHEAWSLYAMAEAGMPLGRHAAAREQLERAEQLLRAHPDHPSEIITYGLLAVLHLGESRYLSARQAAQAALTRILGEQPSVFSTLEGYAGAAEVFVTLVERASAGDAAVLAAARPGGPAELGERARLAVRHLGLFARRFPIGVPRAALLEGRLHVLAGHPAEARKRWQRGLGEARRLGMPHEVRRLEAALTTLTTTDAVLSQ